MFVVVLLLSLQLLAGTDGPLWNGGCCLDGVTGGVRIPDGGGAVTTFDLYFGIEGLLSRLMAEASESFLRAKSFLLRSFIMPSMDVCGSSGGVETFAPPPTTDGRFFSWILAMAAARSPPIAVSCCPGGVFAAEEVPNAGGGGGGGME